MAKKHYKVFWTNTAKSELVDIIEYISENSLTDARKVFSKIEKKASSLEKFPHKGRIVPELEFHNILIYREIILPPWRIIYKIEENNVFILDIFDSRRNLEDILLRRFLRQ